MSSLAKLGLGSGPNSKRPWCPTFRARPHLIFPLVGFLWNQPCPGVLSESDALPPKKATLRLNNSSQQKRGASRASSALSALHRICLPPLFAPDEPFGSPPAKPGGLSSATRRSRTRATGGGGRLPESVWLSQAAYRTSGVRHQ